MSIKRRGWWWLWVSQNLAIRHLLVLLFSLFSLQTRAQPPADWVLINRTETMDVFASKNSRTETTLGTRFWTSADLRGGVSAIAGKPFRSVAIQIETDCQADRIRQVAVMYYERAFNQGELAHKATSVGEWTPTPPGTAGAKVLAFGCKP